MHVVGKKVGKICRKAITDAFFPICAPRLGEGRVDSLFWWGVYPIEEGSSNVLACRGSPHPQFCFLVGHPDLPIKKTLRRVLGLLTVMILKRVRENIFFQSNKFTTCKNEDGNKVKNYSMVFSLLKIIHSFQDKKHLRT